MRADRESGRISAILLGVLLALCALSAHASWMLGGAASGGVVPATWFGATLPTPPTTFTTSATLPSAGSTCHGSYYTPATAAALQTDITAAAAGGCANGDVIEVTAGTTYTTSTATGSCSAACFDFPARTGTAGWVYIVSTHAPEIGGSGLPAAGTRVCPSGTGYPLVGGCTSNTTIGDMATLETSDTTVGCRVIQFEQSASNYRLVGVNPQCTDANGATLGNNAYVIEIANTAATSLSQLPSHITFDRDYIAGSPQYGASKCVWGADGAYIEIENSYTWNCFDPGNADSNAIWWINGPGPIKITNNLLQADGETTLTGGDNIYIPNALASDIDIENNHYYKSNFSGWTGSVTSSSTTLTVSAAPTYTSDPLLVPMAVSDSGSCIPSADKIIKQLTGTTGGVGTYQLASAATCSNASDTLAGYSTGKNMIEFKEGQRIRVKNNYFENAGGAGQPRSGMTVTVVDQYVYTATASISGTSLTVTANTGGGVLCDGQVISGAGVAANTTVSGIGGCTAGTGTFTVSISQTVASEAISGPSCNWVTISDLDAENNVFTNAQFGGFNFLLQDSAASNPATGEGGDSQPAARWLYRNNLVLLNRDDMSSATSLLGLTSAAPGDTTGSGGGGSDIVFDHNTVVAANGSSNGLFFGQGVPGDAAMALSRIVFSNNIYGSATYKFGSNSGSAVGYTAAIAAQVAQPSFQSNVWVGAADATLPASNANPAAVASVGFTSFGSATSAAGYTLTSGSTYHAAGVSGANLPYSSSGTPDGSDLGANVAMLPSN